MPLPEQTKLSMSMPVRAVSYTHLDVYKRQDVYLFNKDEINQVRDAYKGAENRSHLNSFKFDLQDLYADTPKSSMDVNIVWSDQAQSPH